MSVYSDLCDIIKRKTHRELDIVDSALSHLSSMDPKLRVANTFRRLCKIANYATHFNLVDSSHIDYDEESSSLYLTLHGADVNPVVVGCRSENDKVIVGVGDINLTHFDLSENQLDTLVSKMVFDNQLSAWGMHILKAINFYETHDVDILDLSPALGDKSEQHLRELDDEEIELHVEDTKDYTPRSTYTSASTTFVYGTQTTNQATSHPPQPETQVEEHKPDTTVVEPETNVKNIDELKREKLREVLADVSEVMDNDPVVKLCERTGYAGLVRLGDKGFENWKTGVDYTPRDFQEFIAESYINFIGGFSNIAELSKHKGQITDFTNDLIKKLVMVHWNPDVMVRDVAIESLMNTGDWGSDDMTLSLIMDAFNLDLSNAQEISPQLADEIVAVVSKNEANIRSDIDALNLYELVNYGFTCKMEPDSALLIDKRKSDDLMVVLLMLPQRIVFTAIRYMEDGMVDRYSLVNHTSQKSIYSLCNAGIALNSINLPQQANDN